MKYYGQFDPPVDKFIFERYFPDLGIKGVFVECGAFDGSIESSCKFFEESAGWTGYNIEPVPYLFDKLVVNRPKTKNLRLALSDTTGETTFQHVIHPEFGGHFGNGSIRHAAQHQLDLLQQKCTFEEIVVESLTWRDFVAREEISRVDLFVLDVEGHELSVLDGMRGSCVMPAIMCVEFGHVEFSELVRTVEALGYNYDIHSAANAYFVRSDLVGVFALRSSAKARHQECAAATDISEKNTLEIDLLKKRETDLVCLVDELRSRKWISLGLKLKMLRPF